MNRGMWRDRASLKMLVALLGALTLGALVFAGCGGSGASDEDTKTAVTVAPDSSGAEYTGQIRLAMSQWVGYSGLFVAQDEGFFKDAGLDVKLTFIDDPGQRYAAVKSNKLEGVAASVDALARVPSQGVPLTTVYGLDTSAGGDGIVAKNEIASVEDLKGQQIGVSLGSSAEWFLYYVLKQSGIGIDDVKTQNMTSGDAGSAFVAGKIPAAVTWEPYLTEAEKTDFGHVVASSADYPNIIADSLAFRSDFLVEHPGTATKLIDAVVKAHDWIRENPDEAYPIIGKHMGLSAKETADTLEVVKLLTVPENQEFFGTSEDPGPIYQISDEAADFWKQSGQIQEVKPATDYVNPNFVAALSS